MLSRISSHMKKNSMLWIGGLTLVLGGTAALLAPSLLTQTLGGWNFTQTGQIGDTIGGTTAPILSLTGSILVFLAFREQIKANRLIQEQFQKKSGFEQLLRLYDELKTEIESFSYVKVAGPDGGKLIEGPNAVASYGKSFNSHLKHGVVMNEESHRKLQFYLEYFSIIVRKTTTTDLTDDDRYLISTLINQLFQSKLWNIYIHSLNFMKGDDDFYDLPAQTQKILKLIVTLKENLDLLTAGR